METTLITRLSRGMRGLLSIALVGTVAVAAAGEKIFTPETIVNPAAFYPEGPQLIDQGLLVAEMPQHRIVLIDIAAATTKVVWTRDGCGPTSIKRIRSEGYWVLCHLGHYLVRLDNAFQITRVLENTAAGRRIVRPNDGAVDAQGNLYFSTPSPFALEAPAAGWVSFVDAETNTVMDLANGLRYSNGVAVLKHKPLILVSEHLSRRILAFPLEAPRKLGTPTLFFDFNAAPTVANSYALSGPDGLAVFDDGEILVADYGNSRLLHLSATGKFIQAIPVPYAYVTNMAIMPDQRSIYVLMTESNATSELHGMVQRYTVTKDNPKP